MLKHLGYILLIHPLKTEGKSPHIKFFKAELKAFIEAIENQYNVKDF
jgi:hypothetical protein